MRKGEKLAGVFPGVRFGRYQVVSVLTLRKFLCVCDCGTQKAVDGYTLVDGKSTSCGCYRGELTAARNETHGMSNTPTYNSWCSMLSRCQNPNFPKYPQYGGRGIQVCERWLSFETFLSDLGERPEGKTLDRLDVDGDYEPANCRWATVDEQARNKTNSAVITIDGMTKNLTDWARFSGVNHQAISWRIAHGWEPRKAVFAFPGTL